VGDLHADDVGLGDVRVAAEDVGDLVGRHVLGLPAEGVAEAVDEVDAAVGVLALHVAGQEPGVAGREEVRGPALVGRGRVVVVALEIGFFEGWVGEAVHDLAGLAGRDFDGEAGGWVARDFLRVDVHAHALLVGGVEPVPDGAALADGVDAKGPRVVVEGAAEPVGGGV